MNQINLNFYHRHSGFIEQEELARPILIVGAGGIGSWLALCLSKMGCSNITLLDMDTVEEYNVGNQIYSGAFLGKPKVEAWLEASKPLRDLPVTILKKRYEGETSDIVISAVDNMVTRNEIFTRINKDRKVGLFLDGRMAGNVFEIYTVDTPQRRKKYQSTLFTDGEALNVPCTQQTILYNCFAISGLMADCLVQTIKKTTNTILY